MKKYASMNFIKIKSASHLTGAYNHNYREIEVEHANEERHRHNKILIEPPNGTYRETYYAMLQASEHYKSGKKPRKDAVRGLQFRFEFTVPNDVKGNPDPDATYPVPKEYLPDMEKWEKANIEWLNETFGKENVISVIEHNDESVPHIHAVVIPMYKGELNASHWIGKRAQLYELQDSYGEKMSELGLSRGERFSKAKEETIKDWYAIRNKDFNTDLPAPEPGEKTADYFNRVNPVYKELNLKASMYRGEIKDKETLIDTLQSNEAKRIEAAVLKETSSMRMEYEELERSLDDVSLSFSENISGKDVVKALATIDDYVENNPDDAGDVAKMLNLIERMIADEDEETYLKKNEYTKTFKDHEISL